MKVTRGGRLLGIGAVCSALLACESGGDTSSEPTVEIGLLVEQADSTDTQKEVAAVLLAVREVNDAGGITIDGVDHRLELVIEDHGGSAKTAVEALERLHDAGVTAVVGPPWSSLALGDEPDFSDGVSMAARRLDMLLVSPTASAPSITDLDDDELQWRTIPSDSYQAEIAADEILERGRLRAAVLYRDEAWGRGLSGAFRTAYEAGGGEVVAAVGYDVSGQTITDVEAHDYRAQLDELFGAEPDVVLLLTFDEIFQISSRIAVRGYLDDYDDPPLFFGSDANFTEDLLANGAPEVVERMVGVAPLVDVDSAGYRAYAAMAAAVDLDITDSGSPYRFDAAMLIALGMQAAGSTEASEIKRVLEVVSRADDGDVEISVDGFAEAKETLAAGGGIDYWGASGPIEFSPAGDTTTGVYVVWKVEVTGDGRFEYDLGETVQFFAD